MCVAVRVSCCRQLGSLVLRVCCSKSFLLSSAGFTCVAFVSGALALWAPEYMIKALRIESKSTDVNKTTYVSQSVTDTCGCTHHAGGASR